MGRKYYLDPVTKEKIYIRNTVSKPPVIDVQVNGESVLEDRIANINLSDKQDTLVSGVNIKTINNESILGPGNIRIAGGSGGAVDVIKVNGVEQPNSDGVVNLEVPTKTSDLQNDSGFLTDISGKQDIIADLDTIRAGAEKGSTALQSVPSEYITETELEEKNYATKKYVVDKVNEASMSGGYVHPDTHPASMITGLSKVATSGNYNDLSNKPTIPTKTSELTNDSEFITETELNAKGYLAAESDPKYTADKPSIALKSEIPTRVSQLTNDSGFLTEHQDISGKVDKVSGKGLSTNDLTDALKSNYDAAYTHSQSAHAPSNAQANVIEDIKVNNVSLKVTDKSVNIDLSGKVDKVSGKGLSTNDYTTAEKNKLAGIAENANNYTHPSTHDATMITEDTTHRFVTDTEKATWNAKSNFSGSYNDLTNKPTIPTVDAALSSTSTNAIQNKAVNNALSGKANSVHKHAASDVTGLATVATSGSYNDLSNTPAEVTESTVSGWGFTKSSGTVTSVKMNNTSKTPVNGVIDLGTVITDISGKQDTIPDLESIRTNAEAGAGLSTQVITNKTDITNIKGKLNDYLQLTGGTISGNITPNVDNAVSLGSDTKRFKEIYAHDLKLSANSLYLGDTKVLGTDTDTINIKGNAGQNVALKSQGAGTTNIQSFSGVTIETVAENDANPDGSTIRLKALGNGSSISMDASSIGLTGNTTINNLTVTGNLNVSGTTTTVNSQNLDVKDNIIEINKGETGAGVSKGTAGIKIDRGSSPDFLVVYDESDSKLKAGLEENVKPIATEEYVNSITSTKLDSSATATSAEKLTTSAGSATQPVYFSNGVPANTTYTLGASVPANAKFTDTTYTASDGIAITGTNITNSGVRSISTGSTNGTISVNTGGTSKEVAVKGLGTAAYTSKDNYAAATHNHTKSDITDFSHTHDDRYYTETETNTLLNSKVNTSDIVDSLTSTDTDKPLSANQGKELKTLVDGKANSNHTHDDRYYTESEIDTKVEELNTAIANSGKFYGIDTSKVLATNVSSYTATEDCIMVHNRYGNNIQQITVDGVNLNVTSDRYCDGVIPLKKGQTLKISINSGSMKVYGLKG